MNHYANRKPHVLLSLAAAAGLTLAAGCVEHDDYDIGEHAEEVYMFASKIWSAHTISVCWENPSSGNANERQWVRDAVEATWEAVSIVDFTGWGTCASNAPGIRISIQDSQPLARGLGTDLDGVSGGISLNFTYNNWGQACKNARYDCIKNHAVHEFGHALGFAHEHNRPDTPGSCTAAPQGTSGDWMLGAWDADSIMNYCNHAVTTVTANCKPSFPDFWNDDCTYTGPRHTLSAGDIAGVRVVYGYKPTIALRSHNGQYLRVAGGGGGDVVADRHYIDDHEQLRVLVGGNGMVALRSHLGHYLRAETGGGSYLKADVKQVGPHEQFSIVDAGGGKVAVRTISGHYLSAEGGGGAIVNASRTAIGDWEKFDLIDVKGTRHQLQSVNGNPVAWRMSDNTITADGLTPAFERVFDRIDLKNGQFAFRTLDGRYLSADPSGALTANVKWLSTDERFTIHAAQNNGVALRSTHGKYMAAEGGGGGAVNANGTAIGGWESFQHDASNCCVSGYWSFYYVDEPIRANLDCSGQATSTTDWVGIYPRGVTPGQQGSTAWVYTSGTHWPSSNFCRGKVVIDASTPGFSNITPGEWTLWYLKNDGYVPFGSYDFTVL